MHSDVDMDEENEFDDESNLGGMSQTMLDLCDRVDVHEEDEQAPQQATGQAERTRDVMSPVDEERALALEALRAAENHGAEPVDGICHSGADGLSSQLNEPESPKVPSDDDGGVEAREPDSRGDGVAAVQSSLGVKTESRLNDEEAPKKNHKKSGAGFGSETETSVDGIIDTQSPIRSHVAKAANAVTEHLSQDASATGKKASPRNVRLVGKTMNKIRDGEAGPTVFSAFDLPGGSRKKKKQEKASASG